MRADTLRLAADLARRGEPFVLITVVRREPPSSARLGDSALVTRGGAFHGWLGGSCTQPTAIREALRSLADGAPRLVALVPDAATVNRPGITVLPMTCHSGGSVDLYIEPVLPAPQLLILGTSPTAQVLCRLAKVMGYTVFAVDAQADESLFPEADAISTDRDFSNIRPRLNRHPARLFAVIATLGDRDEEAARAVLALDPAYVGIVASKKRFGQIRASLADGGLEPELLERLKGPAGLDIGAGTHQEIALSILAEIVQRAPRRHSDARTIPAEQRDPVCGMTVSTTEATPHAEYGDVTYYFCCAHCRDRFLAAPAEYATGRTSERPHEA